MSDLTINNHALSAANAYKLRSGQELAAREGTKTEGSTMADLTIHNRAYPMMNFEKVVQDQPEHSPDNVDKIYIRAGQDTYVASAKGIDFRGVRLGEAVKAGNIEGELIDLRDRPDTASDKVNVTFSKLESLKDSVRLNLALVLEKLQFLPLYFSSK